MKKRKMIFLAFGLIISALFFTSPDVQAARPNIGWNEWVTQLRAEAVQKGIRPAVFDMAFQNIHGPDQHVLNFDRSQPETRITYLKYRNTRGDTYRIKIGRIKYAKYKPILTEIGNKFGVNPCFIVSLWGMETSYGSFMGNFPVIKSLATLAYDTRRSVYFREQLFYALEILNGGHVDMKDFKGEWAGASGQPQFLPSSWHNYAVDYDKDGRKDIWKSFPDAFASIANYLAQNGWERNEPWAITVVVPAGFDESLLNSKTAKSVEEWREMGLRTVDGRPWPSASLKAKLIRPLGGPDMLTFHNFDVLMKWNRSIYYAGTVGYVAEQICNRPLE